MVIFNHRYYLMIIFYIQYYTYIYILISYLIQIPLAMSQIFKRQAHFRSNGLSATGARQLLEALPAEANADFTRKNMDMLSPETIRKVPKMMETVWVGNLCFLPVKIEFVLNIYIYIILENDGNQFQGKWLSLFFHLKPGLVAKSLENSPFDDSRLRQLECVDLSQNDLSNDVGASFSGLAGVGGWFFVPNIT